MIWCWPAVKNVHRPYSMAALENAILYFCQSCFHEQAKTEITMDTKCEYCAFCIYMFSGDCIKLNFNYIMICTVFWSKRILQYFFESYNFLGLHGFTIKNKNKRWIVYSGKIWRLECQGIHFTTTVQNISIKKKLSNIDCRVHS